MNLKNPWRLAGLVAAFALVALASHIAYAFLGGVVINGSYAVSQVLPIPLGDGVSNLGAVVSYSSPTFTDATFTTGQVSTGTITIASNALLSTAAATTSVTVQSVTGSSFGDSISFSCPVQPGAVVVKYPRDWAYGATTAATATNIAAALTARGACLGGVSFGATGRGVYATAPVGGLYNKINVVANNAATLSVSSANMTGGNDAAIVWVNGAPFQAGLNFGIGASATASATNLAAAINTALGSLITATATGANVALQSVNAGNEFPLATSNTAAMTVSVPFTYGAIAPSWALGGKVINIPAHGFLTGLPVLYTEGSSPAIGGLTTGTTYYVGVVDANNISLASTQADAVAGTFITLTSSRSLTTAVTYGVTPLAFLTGSSGFDWVVSQSASGPWETIQTSSVTYSTPGSAVWSFGALPYAYLGLNLTAPTQGALTIQVSAQGN